MSWLALTPTVLEIRRWNLPGFLVPLYVPLRQYRLISKYLRRAIRYVLVRQARGPVPPTIRAELVESLLKQGLAVRIAAQGRSMLPTYGSPTEVIVRPVSVEEIGPGDTVLYRSASGDLRLHRVVQIDRAAGVVMIKGDASTDQVERVPLQHVLGTLSPRAPGSGLD